MYHVYKKKGIASGQNSNKEFKCLEKEKCSLFQRILSSKSKEVFTSLEMAFVDLVECTTSYNIISNRDNNAIEVMICPILSPL